jgi:adenylate kinase family enzyme
VPLLGAGDPLPHAELDAFHHGPGWTVRPEFEADVRRVTGGPTWATEWQYTAVRELLLDRADVLVWLDLPRRVVMSRVVRRTLRRRIRREVLWNGNTEPPLRTFLTDRDHIVRWAWRTHPRTRDRVLAALAGRPELPVVRLRSHAEVVGWLAEPLRSSAG